MLASNQPLALWFGWLVALLIIVSGCLGGAYLGVWQFADIREILMAVVGGLMVSFSPSPMQAIRTRLTDRTGSRGEEGQDAGTIRQ